MRIDAHHHVWDLDVREQPWTAELPALHRSFGIDELRPTLVTNEIDATVLVQTICITDETPELLALADAEPVIAGVVGWIDLTAPDAADQLAMLQDGSAFINLSTSGVVVLPPGYAASIPPPQITAVVSAADSNRPQLQAD